jgi:putative AlgH/UPF0301 family transcriptional regulator
MTLKRYAGHLLAANPKNPKDELRKSVILLVTHGDDLAIGLQINYPLGDGTLQSVAGALGISIDGEDPLWCGGGQSQGKVHVIHSADWMSSSSVMVGKNLAVTNDISVLAALSENCGPEFYRACAGHWVWNGKDLDLGLTSQKNQFPGMHITRRWEAIPATPELIFNNSGEEQWHQVLQASTRHQVSSWF